MILTVHGIRTDGQDNVDLLGTELISMGHSVQDYDYEKVGIFAGRRRKTQYNRARGLYRRVQETPGRPSAICHSWGCLACLRSMELGAHYESLFWFSPAMDRDFIIPNWGCKKLYVFHNPEDRAIMLGGSLWWNDFGKMGTHGSSYADLDHRIKNIEATPSGTDWWQHSSWFEGPNLEYYAAYIDEKISND